MWWQARHAQALDVALAQQQEALVAAQARHSFTPLMSSKLGLACQAPGDRTFCLAMLSCNPRRLSDALFCCTGSKDALCIDATRSWCPCLQAEAMQWRLRCESGRAGGATIVA